MEKNYPTDNQSVILMWQKIGLYDFDKNHSTLSYENHNNHKFHQFCVYENLLVGKV